MKFKVGDKVKLVNFEYPSENGKVGVIIQIYKSHTSPLLTIKYPYKVKIDEKFSPPVEESEIDFYQKKGEQLLFPFMNEKQ